MSDFQGQWTVNKGGSNRTVFADVNNVIAFVAVKNEGPAPVELTYSPNLIGIRIEAGGTAVVRSDLVTLKCIGETEVESNGTFQVHIAP